MKPCTPFINKNLFVSEQDLKLIREWPSEIKAIFDPVADRELAQRIAQEKQRQAGNQTEDEEEIPF